MEDQRELCPECGYDSTRWRVRDAITHMDALGWWWRHALVGLDQAEVLGDTAATAIFSYDSHYCSVDDPRDAKLLACSYFEAGLRVFDIRNPAAPVEVAYYNPPAGIGMPPGGASYIGAGAVQWNLSTPQIRLDDCQIWTTTTHSGLQVLQLTDKAWSACPSAPAPAQASRVAETTLSPLDPLILSGRTAGIGAGSCVIRPAGLRST